MVFGKANSKGKNKKVEWWWLDMNQRSEGVWLGLQSVWVQGEKEEVVASRGGALPLVVVHWKSHKNFDLQCCLNLHAFVPSSIYIYMNYSPTIDCRHHNRDEVIQVDLILDVDKYQLNENMGEIKSNLSLMHKDKSSPKKMKKTSLKKALVSRLNEDFKCYRIVTISTQCSTRWRLSARL